MGAARRFVPALGFDRLTRFYDPLVRLFLQEDTVKLNLVQQAAHALASLFGIPVVGTATFTMMLKRACPAAEVVGAPPQVLGRGLLRSSPMLAIVTGTIGILLLLQCQISYAHSGTVCLDTSASPGEQLERAKAETNYADCLDTLATQQGKGCKPPAGVDLSTADAYWACLEKAGCDVACGSRAGVFRELAAMTWEYHFFLTRCEETALPTICRQVQIVDELMRHAAHRLSFPAAYGPRTF